MQGNCFGLFQSDFVVFCFRSEEREKKDNSTGETVLKEKFVTQLASLVHGC